VAAALAAGLLAGCGGGAHRAPANASAVTPESAFAGAALPTPRPVPAFALRDTSGRAVELPAAGGRITVVAFIDSGCRVCVLIGQQIRGALDELTGAEPAVLLVSVDPTLDTPAHVAAFLAGVSLTGRARYLTGPPRELPAVWRAYGVVTPAAGQTRRFEAAATVFVLDGQGRERVLYQQEQLTPEALAHDVRVLGRG
jgi:protein SCO1